MSQTLTIDVPDEVYAGLTAEAAASGKSVTQVATDRLAAASAVRPGDRLRAIRGIITTGPGDLSTRTDEYLGRAYLDPHDPGPGADR